ncbi:MAG: guanylate kinase [Piscirickettsiaceae bacterium]|nr:guanylate kinase [Piscirickettsiaceae bacterium]
MGGSLFIVAAPSGAGKTSLLKALVAKQQQIKVSVSYTTRLARDGELNGKDYFFVSQEKFAYMYKSGYFLESAIVFSNSYGTSRRMITTQLNKGRDIILEIDWQGAGQIRNTYPNCTSIFIFPPSKVALAQRLQGRCQDDERTILCRMRDSENEMSHYIEFDHLIINDDFGLALTRLEGIISSKDHSLDCNCKQY